MELPARFVRRDLVRRRFHGGIRLFAGFLAKPAADDDLSDMVADGYAAVWLLRGGGIYRDAAGTVVLRPGDLVQRLPGRRHTTIGDAARTWVEFFIDVDAPLFHGLVAAGAADGARGVLHPGLDPALLVRCERFLDALRAATHDDGGRMLAAAHTLLAELFARDRQPAPDDRTAQAIAEAAARLDQDLHLPLAMPALARRVGLGYEAFRKAFAARMGCAPAAYRLRRRIEHAQTLLARRDGDLATVAAAVGYADAFAFAKAFRRQVGVAPGRFRARPQG